MTPLAVALAPAMASTPRAAALRVAPFFAARTAATANQSTLWFAAVDRTFITESTGLGGHPEIVREMARSTSLTRAEDRRSREITRQRLEGGRGPGGARGGPRPPPHARRRARRRARHPSGPGATAAGHPPRARPRPPDR